MESFYTNCSKADEKEEGKKFAVKSFLQMPSKVYSFVKS